MRRTLIAAGLIAAAVAGACGQLRGSRDAEEFSLPLAKGEDEKQVLSILNHIVRAHETYLNVPVPDGRMLRVLASAADAQNVVEVGTSTGYSGLWLCLALEKTGGRLTTFEIDHGRALMAREHFREAGVEKLVTVVEGDAHETLARVKGPLDLVFIDADKDGYVDYLNRLMPLVKPGGLVLAHNIGSAPEYVRAVTTNPEWETVFYREGAGMSITLKKR
jgi:caffeoyl-CoA O-methyltransferase